mmetsp:Transcript_4936/g.22104  ORF Transcript_4936/g.22104 Transcript_4936/m.22104 type:complete len:133 (+) Transcript_4936:966-1364(+)
MRGIRREIHPNSVRVLTFKGCRLKISSVLVDAQSCRGYSGLLSTLEASRSIASRASFGTCGFRPNARIPLKHASNPRNACVLLRALAREEKPSADDAGYHAAQLRPADALRAAPSPKELRAGATMTSASESA